MISGWRLVISCLAISISLLTSCTESPHPIDIKKLDHPNPTAYIFNLPVNKLRDTVIKLFDFKYQMNDKILEQIFYYKSEPNDSDIHAISFSPETSNNPIFGEKYFKKPNTQNDVFLNEGGFAWYSKMYFHKEKPFEYRTAFVVQFKEMSKDRTLLTIKAVDPKILNGTKCCGMHLGNISIEQSVKPTTIEEYTLILYIAQKLGVKGMNPLQLPN